MTPAYPARSCPHLGLALLIEEHRRQDPTHTLAPVIKQYEAEDVDRTKPACARSTQSYLCRRRRKEKRENERGEKGERREGSKEKRGRRRKGSRRGMVSSSHQVQRLHPFGRRFRVPFGSRSFRSLWWSASRRCSAFWCSSLVEKEANHLFAPLVDRYTGRRF